MNWFKRHWKLVCILLGVLLLRLPSFFEPYWYGDEGIYLAIGQAMQRGAVLYRDIWDNKPPLLYLIYAIAPTLLWAKVTATICVLGTCAGVYSFSKKLWPVIAVGVLMSLPYPILEGTIANAELYFTLPIVLGSLLVYKVLSQKLTNRQSVTASVLLGILFTAAFLLKVPAIFDFLGMFLALSVINFFEKDHAGLQKIPSFVATQLKFYLPILLTFLLVLIPIILYFYVNKALGDFLTASFSQNASYVAVGTGPLSKLSNPLFVKAFELLLTIIFLALLFIKKRITKEFLFLSFWFGFSLYGALLSNRPYPHYLLQAVPPAVLLVFHLLSNVKKNLLFLVILGIIIWQSMVMFGQNKVIFGLLRNLNNSYYSNFWQYITEQKPWTDYVNFFDPGTSNNYDIAKYLDQNSKPTDPIFVWGDASFVYVLSNRPPATKFIQAHHLTTIPPVNYDLIMERLNKYQPKFVIISQPIRFGFPKLEAFVRKNYLLVNTFNNLYVYQNISNLNPPKFNPSYYH